MLGLLGGLLGGGLLRGLSSMRGGSQQRTAPPAPRTQVAAASPMQQSSPAPAAPPPESAPPQQPRPPQAQPLASTASSTVQQTPQPPNPLSGLLDDKTPAPPTPRPLPDQQAMPKQVVNTTAARTPVARQADEQFGARPVAEPTEIPNQINRGEPLPSRLRVDFMDMNPSRKPNAPNSYSPDLGYSMSPPSAGFSNPSPFRYMR